MTAEEQGIIMRPAVKGRKFIAVDLDGTLAHYDRFVGRTHIGEPVPSMLRLVRMLMNSGHVVIIFTSRVSDPTKDNSDVYAAIHEWCEKHIGERLYVTATKWPYFNVIYDDAAVAVRTNQGPITTA